MSDQGLDLDAVATIDQDAHLAIDNATVGSALLPTDAAMRVRAIDQLMEVHRQAMSALAALRNNAVHELASKTSAVGAAQALGVTRQAVYRVLQEKRKETPTNSSNTVFIGERIHLDGKAFQHCTFKWCTLVYTATAPFTLTDSAIEDCQWSLEGPAALALEFLRALHASGQGSGRSVVTELLGSMVGQGDGSE